MQKTQFGFEDVNAVVKVLPEGENRTENVAPTYIRTEDLLALAEGSRSPSVVQ